MSRPCETRDTAEPVLFDAILTPHRSLGPGGFVALMTAICVISFIGGLFFFLAGAWPVVGFLGADVLLIYLAFKVNYRRARMYESVTLTPRQLRIERVDHRGRVRGWQFQPHWLQIMIDDPPAHGSQLRLRSHGRSLAIGAFLTPAERLELALALRRALRQLTAPDPFGC